MFTITVKSGYYTQSSEAQGNSWEGSNYIDMTIYYFMPVSIFLMPWSWHYKTKLIALGLDQNVTWNLNDADNDSQN